MHHEAFPWVGLLQRRARIILAGIGNAGTTGVLKLAEIPGHRNDEMWLTRTFYSFLFYSCCSLLFVAGEL